jgi:hypothetical protein
MKQMQKHARSKCAELKIKALRKYQQSKCAELYALTSCGLLQCFTIKKTGQRYR